MKNTDAAVKKNHSLIESFEKKAKIFSLVCHICKRIRKAKGSHNRLEILISC